MFRWSVLVLWFTAIRWVGTVAESSSLMDRGHAVCRNEKADAPVLSNNNHYITSPPGSRQPVEVKSRKFTRRKILRVPQGSLTRSEIKFAKRLSFVGGSSEKRLDTRSTVSGLQAIRGGMLDEVRDPDSLSTSSENPEDKSDQYQQKYRKETTSSDTPTAFISKESLVQRTTQRASQVWERYIGQRISSLSVGHEASSQNHPRNLLQWSTSALPSKMHQFFVWLWVSFLVHDPKHGGGPTLAGMYCGSLVGASCGFCLFLYFISYGYAAGIGLPLCLALTQFIKAADLKPHDFMGIWTRTERTVVQTLFVILWSMRMFLFLGWREFVTWPALHKRILQVNQQPAAKEEEESDANSRKDMKSKEAGTEHGVALSDEESTVSAPQQGPPGLVSKVLCWLVYSFFYLCMLSPCFFRMRNDLKAGVLTTKIKAGDAAQTAENFALCLQGFGLVLESIADWQKSYFKSRLNCRYEWCGKASGLSLWKWSTHPNYLGEGLFWSGTFLSGMISLAVHFFSADLGFADSVWQVGMMVVGFGFILKVLQGATESLDERQEEKYKDSPEYVQFREQHGFFGPHWGRQKKVQKLNDDSVESIVEEVQTSTNT